MKQITIDEMLEILRAMEHPQAAGLIATVETIGTHMASMIADRLGVFADAATFEGTAFGGTCAPFGPHAHRPTDPIPEELAPYDQGADWCFGASVEG